MRTETIEVTYYTAAELQELHPRGFEHARMQYAQRVDDYGHLWSEIGDSLGAIERAVVCINPSDYADEADGIREAGDMCAYTGTWADGCIADAAADAMAQGEGYDVVLAQMTDAATRMYEAELEYQSSEEAFIETSECNDWEYTEDGDLV